MATPTRLKKRRASRRSLQIAGIVALLIGSQAAVGWWVYTTVESSLEANLAADLETILDAEVKGLQLWFDTHESAVSVATAEARVRNAVQRLLEIVHRPGVTPAEIKSSPPWMELQEYLGPLLRANDYDDFGVIDPQGLLITLKAPEPIEYRDREAGLGGLEFIEQVLSGSPVVSRPFLAPSATEGTKGLHDLEATMFVAAPMYDDAGQIIAGLGFGIRPEYFTAILHVARAGESGETYAFDAEGLLISDSRFDDQLREIGLLPDDDEVGSQLRIEIRNPGGDMVEGFRALEPRAQQPLTRMAEDAIQGNSNIDVKGYRDYRGVPVVGAWTWLPKYGFGVTTEIDRAEAYETLNTLKAAFWALIGVLVVSALGMLLAYTVINGLRRNVRRAQRLGQYTLEKKLGEGGMGTVYRARHALLRRPTAVKLLRPDVSSGENIARFEREVQLTSQLTHPNTIAIYDYGHTPDGLFYYAMEYLPGITLDRLVEEHGPQSESRVIHILMQVCGSLHEAHTEGVIHRDIKPANIMLCERGGQYDVVKVLDFGLVKEMDRGSDAAITGVNAITGTPLYLSPEAIRSPDQLDARSDLYSVGAVGYYLLTGEHVFGGDAAIEVFSHHLTTEPERPSERAGHDISRDVEDIVLQCLEKEREKRPSDAEVLRAALERCGDAGSWTTEKARAWWMERPGLSARRKDPGGVTSDSGKLSKTFAVALDDRVRSDS